MPYKTRVYLHHKCFILMRQCGNNFESAGILGFFKIQVMIIMRTVITTLILKKRRNPKNTSIFKIIVPQSHGNKTYLMRVNSDFVGH